MENLLSKVNLFAVLPIIISAIAAFISFFYSRKSKKHADTVLLNSYISEAVKEFERKGSPINYIRSIVLPGEKKEIVWKYCHLRYTGRLPDRLFSDMPSTSSSSMSFILGEYQPVLVALGTGQYEDRTMKSISEEVSLDKGTVNKALNWLLENGLAQKRTAEGGTFWSLTEEGWKVYNSIHTT
jgi:hypothetical protein